MPNYPYTFQLPPLNVQDIPNDGVAGEFLGINGSGVLDWLTAGGGDMLKADNLLGLTSYPTARTNLGLGTGDSPTFANLTLTSPSLGSSAPVTISQTWNAVGQTFKALVVNAAGTSDANSASGSLLADFQLGGTTKAKIDKLGIITANRLILDQSGSFIQIPANTALNWTGTSFLRSPSVGVFSFENNTQANFFTLVAEAANTLALRNGGNPQTFNVYGTYTSITDYRRLTVSCDNTTGNATITANKGSATTGDVGTVSINGVPVGLGKGNVVSNVAVGTSALNGVTTGSQNIAIGYESSIALTNGNGNTSIGFRSLRASTGSQNVSIGADSLQQNSSGSNNTSVGYTALNPNTTGGSNSAIGYDSGRFISGGVTPNTITNNSVYLGALTKANASSETNQIVIGYDATGIGSNSVVLGNDSITKTALKGNVGIGTTAPSTLLHLHKDQNTDTELRVQNSSDLSSATATINLVGSQGSTLVLQANPTTVAAPDATRALIKSTANVFGINLKAESTVGTLQFYTGGGAAANERLRITAAGNLGIGTTSPTSNLTVAQSTTGVGTISVGAAGTTITGVGTQFLNTFAVGQTITSAGQTLTISAIASDTSMTISPAAGAAISGQAYTLVGGTRFSVAGNGKVGIGANVFLERDGDNFLALRNGANAQTFRVYNTYTDASNYERGTITWESNELNIRSEKAGSGQLRNIVINAGLGLKFYFNNSTIGFQYTQSGHLLYFTDNSQDIGASGASRPRNVYVGTAIAAGGGISGQNFGSSAGGYFNWATRSNIFSPADGVIRLANDAQTDFNRLQFGGTTNLFPAIKRSTTYLQARLADDSAFAPIQGKLTTDTAYTATVVAATGYITIYDSTGTAYRVPCAV